MYGLYIPGDSGWKKGEYRFRAGVVPGYRMWTYFRDELRSLAYFINNYTWKLGEVNEAECPHQKLYAVGIGEGEGCPKDEVPSFNHFCGIHAYPDPEKYLRIRSIYLRSYPRPSSEPTIFGSCLLWGRMVWHEGDAYVRAQYALPVAFELSREVLGKAKNPDEYASFLEKVADSYGATLFPSKEDLIGYTEALADAYNNPR